jgi:hypothetical protein
MRLHNSNRVNKLTVKELKTIGTKAIPLALAYGVLPTWPLHEWHKRLYNLAFLLLCPILFRRWGYFSLFAQDKVIVNVHV